jgi:hypothetical protein
MTKIKKIVLGSIAAACLLLVAAVTQNQFDLATQVKGVLPPANGGLGVATAAGAVCMPGAFTSQADGVTVTWAIANQVCSNASLVFTVHGGSRTLNLTGLAIGGSYVLELQQDPTGGEGLVLGSGCAWKVSGGGAGAIALSSTPGAIDMLAFTYDGANCYANFATNFD